MERLTQKIDNIYVAKQRRLSNGDYAGNQFCLNKLGEFEDLEEQGLLLKLPCKVGSAVYVIATCKDFEKVLDGTLYDIDGGFGTATGYYCPYEISDSCPHEDGFEECEGGCECFENKLAVFEDYVENLMIYADEEVMFLGNYGSASFSDFGRKVFLTKEEAEKALKEITKFQKNSEKEVEE